MVIETKGFVVAKKKPTTPRKAAKMQRREPPAASPIAEESPADMTIERDGVSSSDQLTIVVNGVCYVPVEASSGADPRQSNNHQEVKQHLRCPTCWGNYGGRAARRKWWRQVSGPLQKRCYVCDTCGTEWVINVRNDFVDGTKMTKTEIAEVRLP